MPSSRVFRPDNHLLWIGILVSVAVTLYVGTTYWFDADTSPVSTTSAFGTLGQRSRGTGESAPSGVDGAVVEATSDTSTAAMSSPSAQSQQNLRRRRVTFASPTKSGADEAKVVTDSVAVPTHTPTPTHVFLDVAKQDFLKDPFVGKVVIELYTQDAPRTAHNFAELCRDKKYVNTPFHRIIKDFMVQGGDIVNQDGTGTYSVYGGEGSTFADEPFVHAHDRPGLLSMANSGPHTNGSQFFITTAPAPHLDGKHVVFGRVVEGMEHVHDVEREVTDPNDRPIRKCYVMNSGVADKPVDTGRSTGAQQQQPMQAWDTSVGSTPPTAQALATYDSDGMQPSFATSAQTPPIEPVPFQL